MIIILDNKYSYGWLNTYLTIQDEIEVLELQIELNKTELKRWNNYRTRDGDLAKHQTFLTSLERQNKLQKEIDQLETRKEELIRRKKEIISLVDKFEGLEHKILKMKYIENKTLEEVAEELGYSYQYIRRKHAELIKRISFSKTIM